jgi:hypothetical protein
LLTRFLGGGRPAIRSAQPEASRTGRRRRPPRARSARRAPRISIRIVRLALRVCPPRPPASWKVGPARPPFTVRASIITVVGSAFRLWRAGPRGRGRASPPPRCRCRASAATGSTPPASRGTGPREPQDRVHDVPPRGIVPLTPRWTSGSKRCSTSPHSSSVSSTTAPMGAACQPPVTSPMARTGYPCGGNRLQALT